MRHQPGLGLQSESKSKLKISIIIMIIMEIHGGKIAKVACRNGSSSLAALSYVWDICAHCLLWSRLPCLTGPYTSVLVWSQAPSCSPVAVYWPGQRETYPNPWSFAQGRRNSMFLLPTGNMNTQGTDALKRWKILEAKKSLDQSQTKHVVGALVSCQEATKDAKGFQRGNSSTLSCHAMRRCINRIQ